jgi:subtilisin family serine protease
VVAASSNAQTGTQNPFEQIDVSTFTALGDRLVIVKFAGANRFLHLNTQGGRLALATDGQTSGHSAAVGAFSVAAVGVATAGGGPFMGGAANPVETFSSDGPRQSFFNADGTPITPGNFSSTGGTVRQKPDITAADCVATATPGFSSFCGTSVAAPHAAAIGGLVLAAHPTLTPAQVRQVLTSTALDIEATGVDRDAGFGIVDAFAALNAVNVMFGITRHPPTDVNGDGRADLVWRNTRTGQVAVWFLDGPMLLGGVLVDAPVSLDWQLVEAEDVNGDGKADLVWRHTQTGQVAVWLLDGATVLSGALVNSPLSLDWQAE